MNQKEKNDLTLKLFSLFIAIFLWAYVIDEVNPEIRRDFKVDLVFSNAESLDKDSLIVKEPKEAKVTVRVAGKKSDMDNFSPKSIKATVDLSGYTEGQKKVPVKVSLDHQLNSIKIVDNDPKEVLITFDKIVTEEREISLRTVGELEKGYTVTGLTSKSETVLLKGPRTWLNEVEEVVAFVDLEGRTMSSTINAPLRALDSQGNDVIGLEKSPNAIDVDLDIGRYKEVAINLKTNKDLPNGYDIKELIINPKKIKLKGDDRVLSIDSVDTEPINIDELINKGEMEVGLRLPEGVMKLDENEKVIVKLSIIQISEKTLNYKLSDLSILNLTPGLNFEFVDGENASINALIKGDSGKLNNIDKKDVPLHLDLKDLDEGEYNINIGFDEETQWKPVSITPGSVKVRIKK